jgi:hypothetical protein
MDSYTAMQRIYKYLKTPSLNVSFSSYPGTISSTDDFFLINNRLMVTETSLSFQNTQDMQKGIWQANYIPEYYKVVASVRNSKSAKHWINNMKMFTGGIYNS